MKKVILTLAAVLTVVGAQAASKGFNKKNIYLGGSVGYTSTSVKADVIDDNTSQVSQVSNDGSSFKLIVDFGYDLDKKNSIGAQVGYFTGLALMGSMDVNNLNEFILAAAGGYSDMQKGQQDLDISGFRFAPYIRHNLISNKVFDIFIEGAFGYESIKATQKGTNGQGQVRDAGNKIALVEIVGRPGILFKLDKNFSFLTKFGSIGWQHMKTSAINGNTNAAGNEASRFGLSASSGSLLMGIQYHF